MTDLQKLGMPKWGLSMKEGRLVEWLVPEGAQVAVGDEIAEVETDKINGVVESPASGLLRRQVAQPGETLPVGALIGVFAGPDVLDADVDAFVAEFQASFVPEDEEEGGPETETATVDGLRLRYVRTGEGDETVLLLHGFGGDLQNWLFTIPALAESRTVVALDLPGHGGSAKEVGEGTPAAYARVVASFLDEVGVGRAHVVGHSLGGAVAAELALAQPERVRSLVLIGSAGFGAEIDGEYIDGFVSAQSRRELKPWLERLFADPAVVTRQLVDDVLKNKRLDGVEDALRTVAEASFPDGRQAVEIASRLPAEVRTLVLWGADDRIVPSAHASAAPAHARVEVLSGQGHSPHMEAAGEVNRLLAEFLDGA